MTLAFTLAGEPQNAAPMAAYMKNRFVFLGVKTPARTAQAAPLLKQSLTQPWPEVLAWIHELYARPEREYQYVAIALAQRNVKRLTLTELQALKPLVTQKAWWDSVDAWRKVYGTFVDRQPSTKRTVFDWFESSADFWDRRVAITLQLMSKSATDRALLTAAITRDRETDEFFIQKAIGWALRQYSKTDSAWVAAFIADHQLSALATREAAKYLTTAGLPSIRKLPILKTIDRE